MYRIYVTLVIHILVVFLKYVYLDVILLGFVFIVLSQKIVVDYLSNVGVNTLHRNVLLKEIQSAGYKFRYR